MKTINMIELQLPLLEGSKKAKWSKKERRKVAYHWLHGGARDHELHLLGQHRCCGLLLDEVVASVDFQLRLQMRWWVKVLTVLSRTPTLQQERSQMRTHKNLNCSS